MVEDVVQKDARVAILVDPLIVASIHLPTCFGGNKVGVVAKRSVVGKHTLKTIVQRSRGTFEFVIFVAGVVVVHVGVVAMGGLVADSGVVISAEWPHRHWNGAQRWVRLWPCIKISKCVVGGGDAGLPAVRKANVIAQIDFVWSRDGDYRAQAIGRDDRLLHRGQPIYHRVWRNVVEAFVIDGKSYACRRQGG